VSLPLRSFANQEACIDTTEIEASELVPEQFIADQVKRLSSAVGDGLAVNALSGGVDSSVVAMLGYRALGDRLKTYFIQNGLVREGEPERGAPSWPAPWPSWPAPWPVETWYVDFVLSPEPAAARIALPYLVASS
jgi:asparagine synthetase B (glutamine-hydrolysing)